MRIPFSAFFLALTACAMPVLATDKPPAQAFLSVDQIDLRAILPPAPLEGEPRYEADREIFRDTRSLVDSPRWRMAVNDISEAPADMLRNYSCAAGIELSPALVPETMRLLHLAAQDTARPNNVAKNHFKRLRPFRLDPGPTCQPEAEVTNSYDYPSGHTTWGWTWAMILAELLPDQATAILARGRAYGESRIVCGVHNASAVDAGRLSATLSLVRMRVSPDFQKAMDSAGAELRGLVHPPRPVKERCATEANAMSVSVLAFGAKAIP